MRAKALSRRDQCYLAGKRGSLLTKTEAARAWFILAEQIEGYGDIDVPKFRDVITAIRSATIRSKYHERSKL